MNSFLKKGQIAIPCLVVISKTTYMLAILIHLYYFPLTCHYCPFIMFHILFVYTTCIMLFLYYYLCFCGNCGCVAVSRKMCIVEHLILFPNMFCLSLVCIVVALHVISIYDASAMQAQRKTRNNDREENPRKKRKRTSMPKKPPELLSLIHI